MHRAAYLVCCEDFLCSQPERASVKGIEVEKRAGSGVACGLCGPVEPYYASSVTSRIRQVETGPNHRKQTSADLSTRQSEGTPCSRLHHFEAVRP